MKSVILSSIFFFLISCASHRQIVEVPIRVVEKEYVYNTKTDSIIIKDSIDRYVKGDTVYLYKERIKYQYINRTDTICRIDSIPKIIKVETIKEVNNLYSYQKILISIGVISIIIISINMIRHLKV